MYFIYKYNFKFDWRKKKDISPELENYYEDSDEKVHGEENHTYHGFIAQEVQEVLTNHTEVKNGLGLIKNRDTSKKDHCSREPDSKIKTH